MFFVPTVIKFQDSFLFLELGEFFDEAGNTLPQLIWTNGNELLFPFEPVILQLLFPQFATYSELKIVAVESITRFRHSSVVSVSDFSLYLQNTTDRTFNSFSSLIESYLRARDIHLKSEDYPLWLQKLQQQISSSPISSESALSQLQHIQFDLNS